MSKIRFRFSNIKNQHLMQMADKLMKTNKCCRSDALLDIINETRHKNGDALKAACGNPQARLPVRLIPIAVSPDFSGWVIPGGENTDAKEFFKLCKREGIKVDRTPTKTIVHGDVMILEDIITELPENLEVDGDMYINNTTMRKLPNNLVVNGDVDITESCISDLPEKLFVNGDLNIEHRPVTRLPDSLYVEGDLEATGTMISRLPDDLYVGGNLTLDYTPISELPDNLFLKGGLSIVDTDVVKLPNNLVVGGWLDISSTRITEFPENFRGKQLFLSHCDITKIPDNLTTTYDLTLAHTPITSLPDNLIVGGSLDIRNTLISELPDNLVVGRNLNISNTPIYELPDNLIVGGDIYLNSNISELPDTLRVNYGVQNYCWKTKTCDRDHTLNEGDGDDRYICVGCGVVHIKSVFKVHDYTFYVGKIPGINVLTDGVIYVECISIDDGFEKIESIKRHKNRMSRVW